MDLAGRIVITALACVGLPAAGLATSSLAEASRVYVAKGGEYDYFVERLPRLENEVGAPVVPIASFGKSPPTHVADNWASKGLIGRGVARGAAPFGAKFGRRGSCRCKTSIGDTSTERVSALYATTSFQGKGNLDRGLALKIRYHDGFIAYINGIEVARRNLRDLDDAAYQRHGGEWETLYIPAAAGLLNTGRNLFALVVRPIQQHGAPSFDLELRGYSQAKVVVGPIVQQVQSTSAVIAYETDLPTKGGIDFGTSPTALNQRMLSGQKHPVFRHVVRLPKLPAGRVYYRPVVDDQPQTVAYFHTAQPPESVLRFVVYGDMRGGHGTHGKLVRSMLREAPDFVLCTGDMVMRGSDFGDWQQFFRVAGELVSHIPYYPTVGNHDLGRSGYAQRTVSDIFVPWPGPKKRPKFGHWYSFDVSDVHIVMLDSNSYRSSSQLAWLKQDLDSASRRNYRAIFAVTHDGPYSRAIHRGNQYAAENYAPVLARHGVDMLFAGHDHIYQRGKVNNLRYIVSGGGGAPVYPVRCGIRGRKPCKAKDGMDYVRSIHHYVYVRVDRRSFTTCARRIDGTSLERCRRHRLRKK